MADCPLCHHAEIYSNGWITQKIAYRKCAKCGFIFIPRPIPFLTQDIYNADYAHLRGHDLIHSVIHQSKLKTAEWYLKRISSYSSLGTLLDIGCSTGANVAKACELGWKADGMDINTSALSIAQSYLPQVRFYKTLDDPNFIGKNFSAITLFDVIEHIENMHAFIQEVSSLLASKGILFILTPDTSSLSAQIMNNQWPHLFSEHISLFSKQNLVCFLKDYNFRILETGFAWKFVSLEGLYRHAACHCHGLFFKALKALMFPIKRTSLIVPFNIGECYVIAQKL